MSQTRFTLEEIFPDSSQIRNVSVPDYKQVDESAIKMFRFGRISGDFESGI